jgi:hypothetical protein
VASLSFGFTGINKKIDKTYTARNSPSLDTHPEFICIATKELKLGRWIGPMRQGDIERALGGPFQTSPCSTIPKPRKPEEERLIQNFSYPRLPSRLQPASINAGIDISNFPCTWGTAEICASLITSLPAEAQIAIRDVESAYRTVPLAPSEWPATVVRLTEDLYAIDTCAAFGHTASGGLFGLVADAASDIMRHQGIGPIIKFVDDFLFARLPAECIAEYNARRASWRASIATQNGGNVTDTRSHGARFWEGALLENGCHERHVEDYSFELKNMFTGLGKPAEDVGFAYGMGKLNHIFKELGMPWAPHKDQVFASENTFQGMVWSVKHRSVALEEDTRLRYLEACRIWRKSHTHNLAEAQKLAGRLQHATFVIPQGRPYLWALYNFVGVYSALKPDGSIAHSPEKLLTPSTHCRGEVDWWINQLSRPRIGRRLGYPVDVLDIGAFSDASGALGIGVVIGSEWRAWKLDKLWKRDGRDIQWAEAIGFELACRYVFARLPAGRHVRFWCDNISVVDGWRKGRSRNRQVNDVFKRLHAFLDSVGGAAYPRYVASAKNPADGPSRFDFSKLSRSRALPAIPLGPGLDGLIINIDPTSADYTRSRAPPRISESERAARRKLDAEYGNYISELAVSPTVWWDL